MQLSRNRITEEKETNLMQQFASKYIPYWPLFVVAIIIAIGVAYVYIRYATPIYEATATIIIKDEKKGNEESKLVESLTRFHQKRLLKMR